MGDAPRADKALAPLLVATTLALGWVLLPFYGCLLWGAIVALLFAPLQRRLVPRLRGRRTPAALLTLMVAVVIVIVPFALASAALAREGMRAYDLLSSGAWRPALDLRHLFDALPAWVRAPLDRAGLVDFDVLQQRAIAAAAQASQLIATRALSIGQNTFEFAVDLCITVYIAFYLIRDGADLARRVQRALPLPPAYKAELVDRFAAVIRATVKGGLLVAAIQGAAGGLAFAGLGVKSALLWGVLMAFTSLVPAVGAALVWLPVALFLLMTGSVAQGLALLAFGVLVIGLIDNLLRPMLVGKDARMPDYLIMITTLGGVAAMGLNGLVLGPAAAALFLAVWHIQGARHRDGPD
jgi:predicted PurR-regulated permease PerM